jgi:putative ABC transport system permease protein
VGIDTPRSSGGCLRKNKCFWRKAPDRIGTGTLLGAAGGAVATRVLQRLIEGVHSTEPLTFVLMILLLVAAALLASFVPALRASRVDPMIALRQE